MVGVVLEHDVLVGFAAENPAAAVNLAGDGQSALCFEGSAEGLQSNVRGRIPQSGSRLQGEIPDKGSTDQPRGLEA